MGLLKWLLDCDEKYNTGKDNELIEPVAEPAPEPALPINSTIYVMKFGKYVARRTCKDCGNVGEELCCEQCGCMEHVTKSGRNLYGVVWRKHDICQSGMFTWDNMPTQTDKAGYTYSWNWFKWVDKDNTTAIIDSNRYKNDEHGGYYFHDELTPEQIKWVKSSYLKYGPLEDGKLSYRVS